MLSRWLRTWSGPRLRPLLTWLAHLGITPNALTLGGLGLMSVAGLCFALHYPWVGLGALAVGACFDGLDGALAHLTQRTSPFGAFLDSICDHVGDFALYCGLLWPYLQSHASREVILLFFALFGSLFGSQVRSRAQMVGIDTQTIGVFTRCERLLILGLGLLTQHVTLALWLLATFNCGSALQRVLYTIQQVPAAAPVRQGQDPR